MSNYRMSYACGATGGDMSLPNCATLEIERATHQGPLTSLATRLSLGCSPAGSHIARPTAGDRPTRNLPRLLWLWGFARHSLL